MEYLNFKKIHPLVLSVIIGAVVVAGLFTYAYMRIFSLSEQVEHLKAELTLTTAVFSEKTELLDEKASELSTSLSTAEQNIQSTKDSVATVQSQVGGVAETVGEISGTVDTLEKLSKTDPELLQKYSKIFFLNEHYVPERLVNIPKTNLYIERNPKSIHSHVLPHLINLLEDAEKENVTIYVSSAYRSFDEQSSIKSAYTVVYGAGTANQFSADQGYSEHQLGTTVDLITTGLGGKLKGFENTEAYMWLLNNAHRYGFTLSYPEGNTYYIFEPWHWRYVGIKLATFLYSENKHFYDLEQREIDEYLVDVFE